MEALPWRNYNDDPKVYLHHTYVGSSVHTNQTCAAMLQHQEATIRTAQISSQSSLFDFHALNRRFRVLDLEPVYQAD
jgi:hypothetical protein